MGNDSKPPRGELQTKADITRQIYECLLEEERWPRLLERLTREFNSTYSAMLTRNRLTGSVQITATDVLPPERQRAYENYYARLSPASFFDWDGLAIGEVFTDRFYDDYEAYLKSELYNNFFRPLQADHLMFLALRRDRIEDSGLVLRRSRGIGFYDGASIKRLKRLGGHLSNAERLRARMSAPGSGVTNVGAMLNRLGVAAFVADRTGAIRHMTAAAEQLLRNGELFAAVGGRLAVRRQATLEHEIRTAIRDCTDSIDHPEREAWRMLRVTSPDSNRLGPTVFVSAMMWADASGNGLPASLVVINDPHGHRTDLAFQLAGLFGLTSAESRVAVALCDGRSLSAYAASASISVQTARTLLKRAQEKTDTHSQAELVSLLLRSCALIGPGNLIGKS